MGSVLERRAVADLSGSPRSPTFAIETINGSFRQHGCFVMFQCVPVTSLVGLIFTKVDRKKRFKLEIIEAVTGPKSMKPSFFVHHCGLHDMDNFCVCLTLSCPSNPRYLFD